LAFFRGVLRDAPRIVEMETGELFFDEPFTQDVIVKDDLVDACIDNRRTIITRNRTKLRGERLFFFVDHGEVVFDAIRVRPLLEE